MKRSLLIMVALISIVQAHAGGLTEREINRIESEFGIALSSNQVEKLSAVVYPTNSAQWRVDAYSRIETHRKADLDIQVVDMNGDPVEGATVALKMKSNGFRFGGTFSAKDFSDVNGNLNMSTATYKQRLLSMFNAVGLNNGFKPRLTGIHPYLLAVKTWAAANNLPLRGHLLIWPGVDDDSNHLTAAVLADVQSVEAALTNGSSQATIDTLRNDLRATVRSEMETWAASHDVYEWDVINEPLSNHRVQDALGDYDVMAEWFEIAQSNKVAADCRLLINEFQIISSMSESLTPGYYTDRRDRYMTEINRLTNNLAPLHRIGFQSRIKRERHDPQLFYDRLEEWGNAYGMEMVGTEFEVVDVPTNEWKGYVYTEDERAQITEEMMTQYFSHPLVTGLNAWNTINDDVEALVDYSGAPTLQGLVWYYLYRIRFSTDASLASSLGGWTAVRAFKGDYDITVSYKGQDYISAVSLTNDDSVVFQLGSAVADDSNTARVIDAWHYDGLTNGAGLAEGVSTGFVGGAFTPDYSLASIQTARVQWQSDGVTDSLYRNITPSSATNVSAGIYQLSVDYLDADFSGSAAISNGSGRVTFGLRSGSDDTYFRLAFNSGGGSNAQYRIEVKDALNNNLNVATFSGTTLEHLAVRATYDLDADLFKVYYRHNGGSEVQAHSGTLPAGFALDKIRMMVQTYNGGVNWVAGDRVLTDNLVLRKLGDPPPPPVEVVLEAWPMNDVSGTDLSDLTNSAGQAAWSGNAANAQADGLGNLRLTQGSAGNDNLFRNARLTQTNVVVGTYELAFSYAAATIEGGDNGGANVGFGVRDEGTGSDLFIVRLHRQSSELRLQTRIGGVNTTIHDFNAVSLPGPLTIRAVFDLDTDLMDLYYSIDGAAESVVQDIAIVDGEMDMMRLAANLNTSDFGATDFVEIDYLTLRDLNGATPGSLYADWLVDFPTLGSQTNIEDNLLYYAFGANPTNAVATGNWPEYQLQGGGIDYIHFERNDAEARGLAYTVETTDDLVGGSWTNSGYVFIDSGEFDGEFNAVTNRLPTTGTNNFIRLKVEFTP